MKRIKFLSKIILLCVVLIGCEAKEEANLFDLNLIKEKIELAFNWQQKNEKWAIYDWTNATYYRGISAAWKSTGDIKYFDALQKGGQSYDWKPGERWFHADDLAISHSYLDVFEATKDSSILVRTKKRLNSNLKDPSWHFNPERHFEHTYINQPWWWCDALFMAPPVFVKYASITGEDKYLNFSDSLYRSCYDSLFDTKENLFARDLRYTWKNDSTDRKDQFGNKIFWSRGNGWVLGGLAFIINDLPEKHPTRHFYIGLFTKMATRIKDLQPDDGLWRSSLLDASDVHGEMSGTALFTYSMAWGINNGILSREEFLPTIKKSWRAMSDCQKDNGMVGWVQQIGKDPKPASPESWEVYGTGAFMMAGSELLKLKIEE